MKISGSRFVVVACIVVVSVSSTIAAGPQSGAKLQKLNIKTGLWESKRTLTRSGVMPLPVELLNRLSPEQRARMEERMKANSATHTSTITEKHCVTKEELEKDRLALAEAKGCTTTLLDSTSTTVKTKFVCEQEGIQAVGTLELVASDPEHLKGSYHSTAKGNGNTMDVEGTWTSKWMGASCGDVR